LIAGNLISSDHLRILFLIPCVIGIGLLSLRVANNWGSDADDSLYSTIWSDLACTHDEFRKRLFKSKDARYTYCSSGGAKSDDEVEAVRIMDDIWSQDEALRKLAYQHHEARIKELLAKFKKQGHS
jgi:hypothetical protein